MKRTAYMQSALIKEKEEKRYFKQCLVEWDENFLQEVQNTIVLFPFKTVFELVTKGTQGFNLRKINFVFIVIFKCKINLHLSFFFFLCF